MVKDTSYHYRDICNEQTEVVRVVKTCGDKFCNGEECCPHSYAARHLKYDAESRYRTCYLAENLSGLLMFLKRQQVPLDQLEFVTLSQEKATEVNARLYGIVDGRWVSQQQTAYPTAEYL